MLIQQTGMLLLTSLAASTGAPACPLLALGQEQIANIVRAAGAVE